MGDRLHRRLSSILGRPIRAWDVTPPATVNGSGAETQYSGYVSIPDPKPNEAALYAVPAPKLALVSGGSLVASVQFVDASNNVITDAALQTLATQGLTTYAIGATDDATPPNRGFGWTPATGTFYGDWSSLSVPIPSGTGKIFGVSSYLDAGPWRDDTIFPPYNQMVTITSHLQFGDAGSNVVAAVEVATYHYEQILSGGSYDEQQTLASAFVSGQDITLTGVATKKRCKMVISAIRSCTPYCNIQSGGRVEI